LLEGCVVWYQVVWEFSIQFMSRHHISVVIYFQTKKTYEKAHREAERTLELYRKADADIHLSRADVEKVFTCLRIWL
jgi:hypothetical protein